MQVAVKDWITIELDGCIVWNVHNTVFGSKHSLSALAVHFLHSMQPSVTWLNSRSSLAACDWLMPALCRKPASDVAENLGVGFLYGVYWPGNDFELIPMVKMETRHPIEGSFGNEFPSIYSHCGVMAALCSAPFRGGAGSLSNTMSPGPRPTSVQNDTLIHPAVLATTHQRFIQDRQNNGPVA